MISTITGVNYHFSEGEDFFDPDGASEELLETIEKDISDLLDRALELPADKVHEIGRVFIYSDNISREIDVWTEVDGFIAGSILTIFRESSREYLVEGVYAKLYVFTSQFDNEFIDFEICKDEIRRFNKMAPFLSSTERKLEFEDAIVKSLENYKEQQSRELEARPMDIEMGLTFTSAFTIEQIAKLISFLRNEVV
ncbi:MAG: hypothetical protein R3251_04170 [Candidatus Spechtbacterales bacterium]|nr:hypothetical protein [Candidatus Spechtbacterales bacterium]